MKSGRPKEASARTIGPVPDLERHLPSDWWNSLFNSLYLKTDGDIIENDRNTAAEVDLLLKVSELDKNDSILDLCCGQGRHCLELASRGFSRVTGLDRSRYLTRLARSRARKKGLNVTFREGDARKLRLPESSFRCVAIMGNSFGYFEREEDDLNVLKGCKRVLESHGILVLDLADGDYLREHYERRSWEWVDEMHFVCRERSLTKDKARLVTREVVVNAEQGVIADQFYAERLYGEKKILDLLEAAGFDKIRLHDTLKAKSTRNQDLGMMARRIIISARAPHKRPVASSAFSKKNVMVLLGDPARPDRVKLGGRFNEEDFDTLRKLKNALGEIEGFEFIYHDNHDTLMGVLRNNPPEFVLNFCDEGFDNDAFKEPHVPAVLEMLQVPYSGAGPSCLALCYNKSWVRAIASELSIPVPMESFVALEDFASTVPSSFPVILKPNFGDSSFGITKDAVVHTSEELISYLEALRRVQPGPVLVQEFLPGPEYSIGVVGNPGLSYIVLPPLEVDYSELDPELPRILGYESKWVPESPYWTKIKYRRANLDGETRRRLFDYSNILFERLACRDYARFDFRTDADGTIKLLEANPNAGWCWDGKFAIMAEFAGFCYRDLLRMILESAMERVGKSLEVPAPFPASACALSVER